MVRTSFIPSTYTSGQNALCLVNGGVYLLRPAPLLALEEAAGHLNQRAGTVKRKALAPLAGDMSKVFLHKGGGCGTGPLRWQRVEADPGGDMGKEVSGIPNRICERHSIEVDEDHPSA